MEAMIFISLFALALYLSLSVARRIRLTRLSREMTDNEGRLGKTVALIGEMPMGTGRKFWMICSKTKLDCLLVHTEEGYHAYVNRCRHMATPLDWIKDQFFSDDRRYLLCSTHGALYEPQTGTCLEGPCKGLSLFPLPVKLEGQRVIVSCPQGNLTFLKE